jgi:hypothetical protein
MKTEVRLGEFESRSVQTRDVVEVHENTENILHFFNLK